MAKITSKFQVTVPKSIADRYSIRPGDEIEWIPAGDVIRVVPTRAKTPSDDPAARVLLFDRATERHRRRPGPRKQPSGDRGWTREDLYGRGRSR
jgi:AbrB family looped-hinge helix DNA binding protein